MLKANYNYIQLHLCRFNSNKTTDSLWMNATGQATFHQLNVDIYAMAKANGKKKEKDTHTRIEGKKRNGMKSFCRGMCTKSKSQGILKCNFEQFTRWPIIDMICFRVPVEISRAKSEQSTLYTADSWISLALFVRLFLYMCEQFRYVDVFICLWRAAEKKSL